MKKTLTLLILITTILVANAQSDYYNQAKQLYNEAKNDSALTCLDKGLNQDSTDHIKTTKSLLLRSAVLSTLSFYERAMDDAIRAYDICKKQKVDSLMPEALLGIGKVYYFMYNDSVAESYMLRAKEVAEKQNSAKDLMKIDNALAQLFMVTDRNEPGFELAKRSMETAEALKDTMLIIQNLNLFASYYTNLNRWVEKINPDYQRKTKYYLDEAARLAEQQNIPMLIMGIYMRYIRYYRVEKNYEAALSYAEKIIDICDPTNYTMLIQVYDHMVGIYAHMGDTKRVIDSHQKYYKLMQKQSDYNLHRALQEMNTKYKTAEQELQINRQKTQRTILLLVLFVVVALLILLWYFFRLRSKRVKELGEMNRTKDRFFSIISHDLKNPAVAQSEALRQLSKYGNKWNEEQRQEYFDKLLESADGQTQLLYNLLNWAQVQTGRMPYKPVKFDLHYTLESDLGLINNMAQRKGIQFSTEIPRDILVFGDPNMLSTIIRNLLVNAIKYTDKGGEVSLNAQIKGDKCTVSVSDTGIGIKPEKIAQLLASDVKQSQDGTLGEKGTGFGLTVCKELLKKHDSKLQIKSREGEGSQFWFEFTCPQNDNNS